MVILTPRCLSYTTHTRIHTRALCRQLVNTGDSVSVGVRIGIDGGKGRVLYGHGTDFDRRVVHGKGNVYPWRALKHTRSAYVRSLELGYLMPLAIRIEFNVHTRNRATPKFNFACTANNRIINLCQCGL